MLFIGSCAGRFIAFDKATGKELWSYDTKADGGPFSFHGDPLIHENLVLVPADRGCKVGGYIYAFQKETGKLRWKLRAGAPATSFTDGGDSVIAGTRQNEWLAIYPRLGKLKWKFKAAGAIGGCEVPKPAVTDGAVVGFVSQNNIIHLLDVRSGKELRRVQLTSPASTGLFQYKDVFYLGTADGKLRGLIPDTGEWINEQTVPAVLNALLAWSEPGIADAEYAFGVSPKEKGMKGVVLAFSDEFESLLWSQSSESEWTSERPHTWKNWVIAGNCRGEIAAYRATNGTLEWKGHVQGCIRSFGHDDSTLYVGVQEGTVYAYRP